MKKLGVCVRYITDNYGSMLQLLALQKAIECISWDYEFIVYDKKTPSFFMKNITRIFNIYFFQGKLLQIKKKIQLRKKPDIKANNQLRLNEFSEFRKRCFKYYSQTLKGYSALQHGAEKYDAVLVGSDQLWGPEGLDTNFYNLNFVPSRIRKIAYATSFGVKTVPNSTKAKYQTFLNRIEYVSVREQSGQDIVKEITGRDVPVVVDPVMLFDKEDWYKMVPACKEKRTEKYMLCYFLGDNPEHREAVRKLQKVTGWKIVTLPYIDSVVEADNNFGDVQLFSISPEEFLDLIRNAEYICTDSFHGTAFSIINHKNFTVFNRFPESAKYSRNSRIDTICNLLGLEGRRYNGNIVDSYSDSIAYEQVEEKLCKLKKTSWDYLNEALDMGK